MWKRILSYAHRAGFTQNEAGVIVFLAAAMLVGWVLGAMRNEDEPVQPNARVALAAQDSIFRSRSEANENAQVGNSGDIEGEMRPSSTEIMQPSAAAGTVNINRATGKTLETLPGIGPATAKKIIAYRNEHGPFTQIEDLTKVKSIGPKKLEHIRPYITVE